MIAYTTRGSRGEALDTHSCRPRSPSQGVTDEVRLPTFVPRSIWGHPMTGPDGVRIRFGLREALAMLWRTLARFWTLITITLIDPLRAMRTDLQKEGSST